MAASTFIVNGTSQTVTIQSAQTTASQVITFPDCPSSDSVVYAATAATLAAKTLTAPIINGATSASGNFDLSGSSGTFKSCTGANTLSGATTLAATKSLTLAAGTSTAGQAPLYMQSGTNLATPAAGAQEYDGVCFYSTPVASARGVSPSTMYSIVPSTNWDIAETPAAQPAFPTTGDVWTLNPSTTYMFKGQYYITKTTTSVTVAMVFATGASATITSIGYKVLSVNAAANAAPAAPVLSFVTQATSTVVTAATTTQTAIIFEGLIRMGAGVGTLTPQIAFSTTTTLAVMAANSYISFTPIGTDTNNTLGNVG